MTNQKATLTISTSVIGVTLGLAMNTQGEARFFLFAVLIPAFSLAFFALYAIEFGRMVRVGRYIESIEVKVSSYFPQIPNPLGWEKWLNTMSQDGKNPRLPYYLAVPFIFATTSTFSVGMAYLSRLNGPISPKQSIAMLLFIWSFVMTMLLMISLRLRTLRQYYDKFPIEEEVGKDN